MRRWLLFALVLAGAALLPAVTHAQPSPGTIQASGTIQALGPPEVISSQTVAGTTFITQRARYRVTGTLTGSAVADERVILLATGTVILFSDATFTGTVAGHAGTLRISSVFTGDIQSVQGPFVIRSGTGDLATLRGQGTIHASLLPPVTGTYTGVLQFGR